MPEKTDKIKAASRQTLSDFLARNFSGILVVDKLGIIRFANQAAAAILGCSIKQLLGEQCGFPVGTDKTAELTVKSRDSRMIILETRGLATEWDGNAATVVHLQDITERRQKEQELRKLYRAVMEIPSIVMITDTNGVIEFVNPRFTAVTGYTFAETVGRNPRFLKSGKAPPEMYRELWETIKAGREWRGEMINRKKNGELYWESAAISPVKDLEGKITNFIAVTEDITERKRMEAALRESEDKFSKAFQAVPALLSISSLTDGRYIEVNEGFEKTLRYRRDEVIGRPAPQLGIWENPDDRERLVRLLREGNRVRDFETRLRDKTGGIIIGSLSAEIINIKGEECLLALTRDITRIKQAEEKLRKSEQLLSEAQRLAHLGSWEWDIGADKLTASAELFLIFGVSPEELDPTYAGILNMVHPDDRERYASDIQAAIAEKTPYDNYHRIIRPDGTVRILNSQGTVTVDETGTPRSLIGTCQDVTERRQAEETLRDTEQKLRNIVEHSTNLFYMHTSDHILTYVSPQSRQFFDCEPEEAMVRWTELITDNPLNLKAIEATQRAIDTGERQPPYQVECIGRKARKIWVEVNETPLVENGRTVAVVGSLTDITERKKVEEALRESEARYRSLVELAPDAVIIHQDGWFVYANEAALLLFGAATFEQLQGRNLLDLIHPDERDVVRARMLQIRGGEKVASREIRMLRLDGGEVPVEANGVLIEYRGKPAVQAIIRDITERKNTEMTIRESEQRFRTLAAATYEGIAITEQGRILDVNEQLTKILGYERSELIGVKVADLLPPEEHDRVLANILLGQESHIEHEMLCRDGSRRIVEARGKTINQHGHRLRITAIRDVTERKRVEKALLHSEMRYRAIVEAFDGLLYICSQDGRIEFMNDRLVKRTGHDATGERCHKALHDMDEACPWCVNDSVWKGETVRWEVQSPKDNRWYYVVNTPIFNPDGTFSKQAMILDITERKRAEEALRESEEKFAKAFHSAPTIIIISTLEEGRFVEVNEAFERIIGYRRDEIISRTSLEYNIWQNPDDRAKVIRLLHEGKKIRDLEINFRNKAGKIFTGLYSGEIITVNGEQRLLSLVFDITTRKRMEEEIEILNTNLACRATELETANMEMEAFNYTVSHDLRKPLTNINGYCQVINELCGEKLDEQCRGYLRQIYEGTLQMSRLIETLLKFSRLTQVEIQRGTVNLSGLVQFLAAGLRLAEPQRAVTFIIAEGVTCYGDADLLRLALENLLGNAWKYTAKNREALIEFGVTEGDGISAYFVRDNGTGFDMAYADKLFVPFQRLPGTAEFQGHGIGLATVHRIIQRHGGRIWAEGVPGKGAVFYFTLPGASDSPAGNP